LRNIDDVLNDIKDEKLRCELVEHIDEIMEISAILLEQCKYCNHWKLAGYLCDCGMEKV